MPVPFKHDQQDHSIYLPLLHVLNGNGHLSYRGPKKKRIYCHLLTKHHGKNEEDNSITG